MKGRESQAIENTKKKKKKSSGPKVSLGNLVVALKP